MNEELRGHVHVAAAAAVAASLRARSQTHGFLARNNSRHSHSSLQATVSCRMFGCSSYNGAISAFSQIRRKIKLKYLSINLKLY